MANRPEMVLLRTYQPPHVVCFFCGSSELQNHSCDYDNDLVSHNFLCSDCHSDFAVTVVVEEVQ